MSSNGEGAKRYLLPAEKPYQLATWLALDHKPIWVTIFTGLSLPLVIWALLYLQIVLSMIIVCIAAGAYLFLVQVPLLENQKTTVIAKVFRNSSHRLSVWRGDAKFVSTRAESGEIFGLPEATKTRANSFNALLGRMDIRKYDLDDKGLLPAAGYVYDPRHMTYSATIRVTGVPLEGAGEEMIARRADTWAHILDSMNEVGLPVRRLVWQDQTIMGERQDPMTDITAMRRSSRLAETSRPGEDVAQRVMNSMGAVSQQHVTTFTLTFESAILKREAKKEGYTAEDVLMMQLDRFAASLGGATDPLGIHRKWALGYTEMFLYNRLALDPVDGQHLWELGSRGFKPQELTKLAWPDYVNFEPAGYCQLGSTVRKGYYLDVPSPRGLAPKDLGKLILAPVAKTITVVIQPVSNKQMVTRNTFAASGAEGVNKDRRDEGRRVNAEQLVAAEQASQQEQHAVRSRRGAGRVRVYINIPGANQDEVNANANTLITEADKARFVLQPLVSKQFLGVEVLSFAGRGLNSRKVRNW